MLECVVALSLVYAGFVVPGCVARLMVYVARLMVYVAPLLECVAPLLECVERLLRSPVWTNFVLELYFAVLALMGDWLKLPRFLKGPDFVCDCLYFVHCLLKP